MKKLILISLIFTLLDAQKFEIKQIGGTSSLVDIDLSRTEQGLPQPILASAFEILKAEHPDPALPGYIDANPGLISRLTLQDRFKEAFQLGLPIVLAKVVLPVRKKR